MDKIRLICCDDKYYLIEMVDSKISNSFEKTDINSIINESKREKMIKNF